MLKIKEKRYTEMAKTIKPVWCVQTGYANKKHSKKPAAEASA